MILAGVGPFQVCKLRCKILISGSALSGGRLPRNFQNGPFLVTNFHAFLFSFTVLRAASMRDFGTAPFRAAALSVWGRTRASLSAWFESTVSHHMAHGLIPHKAARLTSRATREGFESPRVWVGFPTGCASNNSPGREPGLFYMAA
nr:MAG TPA: hypothetical protein [Caudoviricetes sp.]